MDEHFLKLSIYSPNITGYTLTAEVMWYDQTLVDCMVITTTDIYVGTCSDL